MSDTWVTRKYPTIVLTPETLRASRCDESAFTRAYVERATRWTQRMGDRLSRALWRT